MLLTLAIRDIVLIERVELSFGPGLSVLTGETGAGKSILLDALGLALGARADSGLVRHGAAQGVVTAEFSLPRDHPARFMLEEQGLPVEDTLRLRRIVSADGKSRAFANDEAVGVALLRRLGGTLVEIHGQNEEQGLLDAAVHRRLLDAFGGHDAELAAVRGAHATLREAEAALAAAEAESRRAAQDADYLRHAVDELAKLNPEPGEETKLAEARSLLQHGEKIAAALRDAEGAMGEGGGMESRLRVAARALARVADRAGGQLDGAITALEQALDSVALANQALERASQSVDMDPQALERSEERLFALRAAARKHACAVDALPDVLAGFQARLDLIADNGATVARLTQAMADARKTYAAAAAALTRARTKAAAKLDKAVAAELAPLKLGAAKFSTRLEPAEPGPEGDERVSFLVATNPGAPPGALAKIASGGEMSRFMLALKCALAARGDALAQVFDEVDRGVGGATADAVGERLARLAGDVQVLVVTHSPQVAARGRAHWRIAKATQGAGKNAATSTTVVPLDAAEREEEVARMLSGASITEAARAAARELLNTGA